MGISPEILDRERDFAAAFRRAALNGVRLDRDQVEKLIAEHEAERDASKARVEAATGGAVTNPKSSDQTGLFLAQAGYRLPLTDKGKPSTAAAALESYKEAGDPLVTDILAHRHAVTALTLLLEPRRLLCERGDGRVRTTILTLAANTGRTSSRNENLQQVSREGGMRACHLAEPGCKVISADFASVEVRVGAALSGDEGLKYMVAMGDAYPERKKEFDLHWIAARTVFGEDATKSNRYDAKRYIFRRMYGGEPVTPLMEKVFAAFNQIAPGYAQWDAEQRKRVRRGMTSFTAYSGRTIWLPKRAEHATGNYMIQGTAREFLVDAVERWRRGRWRDALIIPVHDEVIAFDIPEDEAEEATAFLAECMETELAGVRIKAETNKPALAWQDASLCAIPRRSRSRSWCWPTTVPWRCTRCSGRCAAAGSPCRRPPP